MEPANTTNTQISRIDALAMEARMLSANIRMNCFLLAKVFIQAKDEVPHGQWEAWLKENADVSVRTAQDMMASYRKFGGMPQMESIGQAKLFKMLRLPEGTEEAFMEEHDVANMSTREVEKAVAQARAEAQKEIDREREKRLAAEKLIAEAESRPPEIPAEMTRELQKLREETSAKDAEIRRLGEIGNDSIAEQRRLTAENAALQREIAERDELLADQQEDIKRAQQELLGVKSAIAKGDAERVPADQLTAAAFGQAVREFIGRCARMPLMRGTFATMTLKEKQDFNELLATVEKWAKDSRRALECTASEGTVR